MFDKKGLRKLLSIVILIVIIIIAIVQIRGTISKYRSRANSELNFDVAFVAMDFDAHKVDNLTIPKDNTKFYPRVEPFVFDSLCTVANYETNKDTGKKTRTKVAMEYELILTVTTNLPLQYKVTRTRQGISGEQPCTTKEEIVKDTDGTYYKKITIRGSSSGSDGLGEKIKFGIKEDEIDNFKLEVTFPEGYDAVFSDLVESARIELNANQVLSTN